MFSEFRRVEENTSNEQKCPLVLYAKPSNKRFIIPLQKKTVICNWSLLSGKSHSLNILIPSVRMTLILARDYFTAKEKCYFGFCFLVRGIQTILILAAIVAPFASAGIRPVVNRLNQDTTEYYALVFCAFSLPYMVK